MQDLPWIKNRPGPVEDQFLRGLIATQKAFKLSRDEKHDVPIWFSFAAQIYLDILYSSVVSTIRNAI
jgi:hypothetical protein